MSNPFAERLWTACFSSLLLERFLFNELTAAEAQRVRAHLSTCAACSSVLEGMRRAEPLPPLRVVPLRPNRARRAIAVAAAVAAASLLLVLRSHPGERIKGPGFALAAYVQHGVEVRRAGPGETVAAGDALRFVVTAPVAGYVAVLSVDPQGRASIYYPQAARAAPIAAGDETALPLATRLDATLGEERVTALLCPSPVELGPLRAALERGNLDFPEDCQVARWHFVKR
ncbi:MAG TPA: DUF4384 domain-containing protein [Myxococcales bacterium]|jgi:hypothetical protein|nr:DUF4384 domain-containing protein [Myxococcales bacterium]